MPYNTLNVGVGTGRFAKPLSDLGFEIVGIDVSRKMMLKARQKGFHNLILADAHSMPFKDRSFDASIIIHVLHLIQDWPNVVREMARVTEKKVAALLRNRQGEWSNAPNVSGNSSIASPAYADLWTRYAQLRKEMGYPVRRNTRMWQNEQEIRSQLPPMKLVKVSDEVVVTRVIDVIKRFQQRSYPMSQDIPSEIHSKIIRNLLSSVVSTDQKEGETVSTLEDRRIERRIVEELAIWRPDRLRLG
jgi:ubiquinone/menaquinone biosynthesis C-methylase UbiE